MNLLKYFLMGAVIIGAWTAGSVFAIESHEEPSVIFLMGPAVDKSTFNGKTTYGSSIAVEFTAIEHQLEIEVGAQYMSSASPQVMGSQIIFKKPFQLAPTVELGLGLGPNMSRKVRAGDSHWQTGIAFSADLMVWPTKKLGWYASPEYVHGLNSRSDRSLGLSIGLLFPM